MTSRWPEGARPALISVSKTCSSRCVLHTPAPFVERFDSTIQEDKSVSIGSILAKPIGESLFTLFASLTYAYHYLMTLIK